MKCFITNLVSGRLSLTIATQNLENTDTLTNTNNYMVGYDKQPNITAMKVTLQAVVILGPERQAREQAPATKPANLDFKQEGQF